MSYSVEIKEKVVCFYERGNTKAHTAEVFSLSWDTVNKWVKEKQEKGKLEKFRPVGGKSTINTEALIAYIAQNPDAYDREIGEHFGTSATSVRRARIRAGITNKKNSKIQRKRRRKEASVQAKARWEAARGLGIY